MAPLAKQVVSIPFPAGREARTDPKQVEIGRLLEAENVSFESPKRLLKKPGCVALTKAISGSTDTVSAGVSLGDLKDQLLLGTGAKAYAYSASGWVDKGALESVRLSTMPVIRNTRQQTVPDSAAHPLGISVFAWEDSGGGARYSVFDTARGQPIVSNALLSSTGQKPKPIVLGNSVVILYVDTTGHNLMALPIPATSPSTPAAAVSVALGISTAHVYDAAMIGERVFVAYRNSGSPNRICLRHILPSLVVSAETVVSSVSGTATCVAIFGDGSQNVWVALYDGTSVLAYVYDYGIANVVLAGTTIETLANVRNVAGIVQDSTATLFYEISAAATYNALIRTATLTLAGVVSTPAVYARSVGLASKPFVAAGRVHVLAAYQSMLQPTYFLLASGSVVGKIAPSLGGGLTAKSILPEVCSLEAGVFSHAFLQADRIDPEGGNILTQTGAMQATWDFNAPQASVELSDNLHITGGLLAMYDGAQVCEHGFHLFPENVTATPGSGGSMATGAYGYAVIWEWVDNYGDIHRSAPCLIAGVSVTGPTGKVDLSIPTLRLTSKATAIAAVVYRTEANQKVYYRLTPPSSPLLNDATMDAIAYSDTVADASILGNEQLYTTGGEIENIAAPAPLLLANHGLRLILVPAENPYSWWFSKQAVQGVPVEFSDFFVKTVDQRGGPITAIAEMDDKLVIFKRDRLFYHVGTGPSPDGNNDDYSPPIPVITDAGCIDPRSVVATPQGLLYKSAKGWYLLTRGLEAVYIGSGVKDFDDAKATSAVLVPNAREVRITTDRDAILVLNHVAAAWSTNPGMSSVAACVFGGAYTHLHADGTVMQEAAGTFTDAGEAAPMRIVSSWCAFAGLQGFQRVWRLLVLGEYKSPHRLKVGIAYDFDPTIRQEVEIDAETLLKKPAFGDDGPTFGDESPFGGEFPLYLWRVHLVQQRCTAIQVTLTEVPVSPYGEGLSLSAIGFEVGVLPGLARRPAARSF